MSSIVKPVTPQTADRTVPFTYVRASMEAFMAAVLPNVTFYGYFPTTGVETACVVMQQTIGNLKESGLGRIGENGQQSMWFHLEYQVDVYQETQAACDMIADQFFQALRLNRSYLKSAYNLQTYPPKAATDAFEGGIYATGLNLYRKAFTMPLEVEALIP